jgi:hypothetical protein
VINGDASHYLDGNLEVYFSINNNISLTYSIGDVNNYYPIQLGPQTSAAGGVDARTDTGDAANILNSGIVPAKKC